MIKTLTKRVYRQFSTLEMNEAMAKADNPYPTNISEAHRNLNMNRQYLDFKAELHLLASHEVRIRRPLLEKIVN
jgi:hypothetical protein